ncbi:MAG: hypothetical protein M3P44_03370 [Actinomycetota bacterium]|nr:hypothetical protein [Actinomycetota bacterium]
MVPPALTQSLRRIATNARLPRSAAVARLVVVSAGQASTDYVAVLLIVLAIVAGGFAWADGHALADGVRHAFASALCLARGGGSECDLDTSPCVTASDEQRDELSVKLALLRFDDRTALLRETRSDGTVLVTRGKLAAPGLGASLGAKGHLELGKVKLAMGATLEGSALALFERSRSWLVHGSDEADRLVDALRRGDPPPPDMTSDRRGLESSVKLSASAGALGASLGLSVSEVKGVRIDRTTGQRTLFLQRDDDAGVSLTMAEMGTRGERNTLERYGVTVDRDRRPLDLVVLRLGTLQASADLPRRLQAVAGLLSRPTRGGRVWSEETHLDLTDPGNLALARSFLTQVTGGPATRVPNRIDIARALGARLDAVGIEHVRTMAVQSTRTGAGGELGLGGRLGGSYDRTTTRRRLLDAATRGIDGVWRRRPDCLAAASA